MRFSDWQLHRLRDALRAYHRYGRDPVDGRFYNWKDVAEAINETSKVTMKPKLLKLFAERLRQFVEGVTMQGGGRKYPEPKASLNAIAAFVTDQDNDLLSEDELREYAPPRQAALRLLEYLDQAFDTARIPPPSTLEGTYRSCLAEEYGLTIRELTLQRASDDGLIQLMQTEDKYGPEAIDSYEEEWSPQERDKARKSRIVYGGWAILTPEDNLLLFLKHERNGRNRYYLTMASQLSHSSQIPVKGLALLHHDFPVEVDESAVFGPENMPAVRAAVDEKLVIFRRIE